MFTGNICKRKALLLLWFPWWLPSSWFPAPCCRPWSTRTHFLSGLLLTLFLKVKVMGDNEEKEAGFLPLVVALGALGLTFFQVCS